MQESARQTDRDDARVTVAPLDDDAGLKGLCLVARLHQVAAEPQSLRHQLGLGASQPLTIDDLLRAAKHLGLKARRFRSSA